jgi:ECF sigma factor
LNNQQNTIAEDTSTAVRIRVADVVITDDGLGTNNLTVTGPDAVFFEVDGIGLYNKAGTILDYETQTSYSVTVEVDDTTVGGARVTVEETAEVLNVSPQTVMRDWKLARAWLARELRR